MESDTPLTNWQLFIKSRKPTNETIEEPKRVFSSINKQDHWNGVWECRNGLYCIVENWQGLNQFSDLIMYDENGYSVNKNDGWDLMERLSTEGKKYPKAMEMLDEAIKANDKRKREGVSTSSVDSA